jgi:hypothetical protein
MQAISPSALNAHNLSLLESATAKPSVPPLFAAPAPVRSKLSAEQGLHDALDSLIISGRLLMGRYALDTGGARHAGARAFVQSATDTVAGDAAAAGAGAGGAGVAVKFFLRREEFEREELALRHSALAPVVDPDAVVRVVSNFDGAFRAPNGYIYPPCVVMPCGRCLREWLDDPCLPTPEVRSNHSAASARTLGLT